MNCPYYTRIKTSILRIICNCYNYDGDNLLIALLSPGKYVIPQTPLSRGKRKESIKAPLLREFGGSNKLVYYPR
jgi:hypothetical protein